LCSSDPFGLPALEALAARGWLAGLVTQPDRPRGRGRQPEPLPAKIRAQELNIPIFNPEKISAPKALGDLAALVPDYLVIAAYAQYLPKAVRQIPQVACLNIHPSVLPKYRGPSPVVAALWHGDTETGVAIHYTEKGIDTGDILALERVAIEPGTTGGALRDRLADLGAGLLLRTIEELEAGTASAAPQDHSRATLTRLLSSADRELDFSLPATELAHRILALSPEPGALVEVQGSPLRLLHVLSLMASDYKKLDPAARPGAIACPGKGRLAVRCGEGWLELLEVQPAGKKPMGVADWLNGLRDRIPEMLLSRPGDPRPLAVPITEAHLLAAPASPAPAGLRLDHGGGHG